MPLSSLFKRKKDEDLPYRRDPSVDFAGEYAGDQLDPSMQLHWAGNPDLTDKPSGLREQSTPAPAREPVQSLGSKRQTTSSALQTIRERQIRESA
jgi:hypothetical protein